MYKLIVIDDEDIVRNGIKTGSPLGSLGFEIIAEAENGIEAMEKIREYRPDVVLTDIRMPQMNGIELIESISRDFPHIKIVILSGYSEVEYLKTAIKNKVEEYLLKPTCMEEFNEVFTRLRERLDAERQKFDEYDMLQKQLSDSLPYMREKYLNQLIRGYYDSLEAIEEKNRFYKVNLNGDRFAVILFEIDHLYEVLKGHTEEQKQLMLLSVTHIANQVIQDTCPGFFFSGNNSEVVGICGSDAGMKCISSTIFEIQKKVFEYKGLTVSAGVSKEFSDMRKAAVAYRQSLEAIKQKVFLGSESIVFYEDVENISGNSPEQCMFDHDSISNAIYYEQQTELEKLLDAVFAKFEDRMLRQSEYIDKLCLELLFYISRYIQQFNIRFEDILESRNMSFSFIHNLDSLESKKSWLLDLLYEAGRRIGVVRIECTCRIIEETKTFIQANYNNNISLDQIAEKVNKNSAYLSKLFKAETGENYIEYLTRLRIDKAKELLTDIGMKTYEIANMVGYADVSHFNRMFKKHVGLNPSEYREKFRNIQVSYQ